MRAVRMLSFVNESFAVATRHQALNDVVAKVFVSAGVPVTKD